MRFFILSILFILGRLHTQELFRENEKNLTRSFNFKFRYIDDVISLNKVDYFVDCIYAIEFEIKDTTDAARYTPYLGLLLDTDCDGTLRTESYDI